MYSFWIASVGVLMVNSINAQEIIFPTETTERLGESFGECFTPNRERGQCIRLNDCRPLYELLTKNPLSSRDRDFLRRSQCGSRNNDVLVCCAVQSRITPTPIGGDTVDGASLLPSPGVCGSGYMDKIFGGNFTKIDEFPWMALLNYDKPNNQRGFHCGGSLINNRYVLTASHCVNGRGIPSDWRLSTVRLGEWDTNTVTDCDRDDCNQPPVDVPIEQFITHPSYQPGSKNQHHDIALLRLSRPVTYTDFIKPVCLPLAPHLKSSTFEGASLDVAGWGKTETANRSNLKLKARVDGVNLNGCGQVYRRQGVTLQDTQVCAGGETGIDSCSGDSGGPLVGTDTSNPARPYFYLAGLVSFGPTECGKEGWPGVYTRISSYTDWIQRNIRA